jgi:hypothetical protein
MMREAYVAIILIVISIGPLLLHLVRNQWVYRVRTDILAADPAAYRSLPSYEAMMHRFWVCDAAWFVGRGEGADVWEAREKEERQRRGRRILDRRKNH